MVKQKFTSLDISAIVTELQELLGFRLQNCYDISTKVYLFKFAKPEHKKLVLIESGMRVHITDYTREKDGLPGSFCMKLRKHLRTRRLNAVRQLGIDRIVDMEFGTGENKYHLISEYYAQGNIILTDSLYRIIALLRAVSPDDSIKFAVGEHYPFQIAKPFEPLTLEKLEQVINAAPGKDAIKKVFGFKLDYSQPLVEHLLLIGNVDPSKKCLAVKNDYEFIRKLYDILKEGDEILKRLALESNKGFIIFSQGDLYQEFHPILFKQFSNSNYKSFDNYNRAVDEYFSSIETHRQQIKVESHRVNALKKIENVRNEHEMRVKSLVNSQLESEQKAQLIEENLEIVDEAINVIRSALATGMDWNALKQLIEEEKIKKNHIALMIDRLKLETNQITLLLDKYEDDFDSELEDGSNDSDQEDYSGAIKVKVDVDVGLSAFGNATKYYEMKKTSGKKHEKTIEASAKALKSAEQKIMKEMESTKISVTIAKTRKPFWFEKFNWFISSENYLVLSGRDAQQNELLVKRYLKKGDVYIHADIAGSSSIVVKNTTPGDPIPLNTLSQAGTMAIVYSRAWDAKVVTSAYWVNKEQVSKTAPTGEFLPTGSFMIRGKKNYLPPAQLVYGFGLLFKIADESIPRHFHERRPALRGEDSQEHSSIESLIETNNEFLLQPEEEEEVVEEINVKSKDKILNKQTSTSKPFIPAEEPLKANKEKGTQPLPRGKRSKMKRAKEKYKFQDEDEREMRMKLIASSGNSKNTKSDDENGSEDDKDLDNAPLTEIPKSIREIVKDQTIQSPETKHDEEDSKEIQELLQEENVQELDKDEAENLNQLDSLTGCPVEEDLLQNAIPVCAPYQTLQSYKYKIKLIPGGLKKGKAAKSAVHLFKERTDATNAEKDLIKAIPETELIQTMLGKVRLMASGLLENKSKKVNKKKK